VDLPWDIIISRCIAKSWIWVKYRKKITLSRGTNAVFWLDNLNLRYNYYVSLYYIVESEILKTTVHSEIFSISSLFKISITWLLVFVQFFAWNYIINRSLHCGLKIWLLSSRVKSNILLTRCARS
jgi:hypothetical protein